MCSSLVIVAQVVPTQQMRLLMMKIAIAFLTILTIVCPCQNVTRWMTSPVYFFAINEPLKAFSETSAILARSKNPDRFHILPRNVLRDLSQALKATLVYVTT